MITQIKPAIEQKSTCPYCNHELEAIDLLWVGMHICVKARCLSCSIEIIEDLRVGHAIHYAYQIDLAQKCIFGGENLTANKWLGEPLLKSLQLPVHERLKIKREVFKENQKVVILNCIDSYYGHCLLKLLNAQRHLERHQQYGLVVIIPAFLRWMVPEGVSEIWTVEISLKNGQLYYPSINQFVVKECKRFDEIYISEAHSHPSSFDLTKFTKVPKHSFDESAVNIAFIWREDRLWGHPQFILKSPFLKRITLKLGFYSFLLQLQNWSIQYFFKLLKRKLPFANLTITGFGKKTRFPTWIIDSRVDNFDEETEKKLCYLYSKSLLVIGVHGSSMLLPSGHAGMTIDLMPDERWGNFSQDILYQENDPRIAAFRYRYLPFSTYISEVAHIACEMILGWSDYQSRMTADRSLDCQ